MRLLERLKQMTRLVARGVTRVLLFLGLCLVYFLAMPATGLWLVTFGRGGLLRRRPPRDTGWLPPVGYAPDPEEARGQS